MKKPAPKYVYLTHGLPPKILEIPSLRYSTSHVENEVDTEESMLTDSKRQYSDDILLVLDPAKPKAIYPVL